MIRGKNGFWLLVIIFSLIIAVAVLSSDNLIEQVSGEMNGTMGLMMAKKHAAGQNLAELLKGALAWKNNIDEAGAGHQVPGYIRVLDVGSIGLIFMLLPFMVGASVIMIILWI